MPEGIREGEHGDAPERRLCGLTIEEARVAKEELSAIFKDKFPNVWIATGISLDEDGTYNIAIGVTDVVNDQGQRLTDYIQGTRNIQWMNIPVAGVSTPEASVS